MYKRQVYIPFIQTKKICFCIYFGHCITVFIYLSSNTITGKGLAHREHQSVYFIRYSDVLYQEFGLGQKGSEIIELSNFNNSNSLFCKHLHCMYRKFLSHRLAIHLNSFLYCTAYFDSITFCFILFYSFYPWVFY